MQAAALLFPATPPATSPADPVDRDPLVEPTEFGALFDGPAAGDSSTPAETDDIPPDTNPPAEAWPGENLPQPAAFWSAVLDLPVASPAAPHIPGAAELPGTDTEALVQPDAVAVGAPPSATAAGQTTDWPATATGAPNEAFVSTQKAVSDNARSDSIAAVSPPPPGLTLAVADGPPTPLAIAAPPAQPLAQSVIASPPILPGMEADPPVAGIPAFWQLRLASDPRAAPESPPQAHAALVDGEEPAILLPDAPDAPDVPADVTGTDALLPIHSQPFAPLASPPGQVQPTGPSPASLPPAIPAQIAAVLPARPDAPVELRLSPAELGRLRLRLSQEGEALRVTVQVERPETLELLRRHADVLLTEIRSAGFSGGTLSFSGWGGGGDAGERADPPARAATRDVSPGVPAEARGPQPAPFSPAPGTLNLRL